MFCPRLKLLIPQYYLEKNLRRSLSLNQVSAKLFSWDFSDIFKNIFLVELVRVAASKCHFQRNI